MISIQLGRFKWLRIFNPLRRANWKFYWTQGVRQIAFVCHEF